MGWADWDFVGLSLLNSADAGGSLERSAQGGFARLADMWSAILEESWESYSRVWPDVEIRLTEYASRFGCEWNAIGEDVFRAVRRISEAEWDPEHIDVYLVDCLNGGVSFVDTVLLAPVSDFEVEKKLLSHEVAEGAFAVNGLQGRLESLGVNPGVFHTFVDMTAYFAVKERLNADYVERLAPNPACYVVVEPVRSAFEECAVLSEAYLGLDGLLAVVKKKSGAD